MNNQEARLCGSEQLCMYVYVWMTCVTYNGFRKDEAGK